MRERERMVSAKAPQQGEREIMYGSLREKRDGE
jgi:hypothetical protein